MLRNRTRKTKAKVKGGVVQSTPNDKNMYKKRKPIPEAKLKALQEFRVLSIKYHAKGDEIPKYVYDRLYKALMS